MTINPYFGSQKGYSNEQSLLQSLSNEVIQQAGFDLHYIPRTLNNINDIMNEDAISSFETYYTIEMYLESTDGFEGSELMSKFGLLISDESSLIVSLSRFKEVTDLDYPKEGDLIMAPLTNTLFEINYVEDEKPFYPLGSIPTVKINVKTFRYSEEAMSTGLDVIDDLEIDQLQQDIFADNTVIETEADSVLDSSEVSPFGGF